jgi:hypothetical protein
MLERVPAVALSSTVGPWCRPSGTVIALVCVVAKMIPSARRSRIASTSTRSSPASPPVSPANSMNPCRYAASTAPFTTSPASPDEVTVSSTNPIVRDGPGRGPLTRAPRR